MKGWNEIKEIWDIKETSDSAGLKHIGEHAHWCNDDFSFFHFEISADNILTLVVSSVGAGPYQFWLQLLHKFQNKIFIWCSDTVIFVIFIQLSEKKKAFYY